MELKEMYGSNKKATRALYKKIKSIKGIELLEFESGIRFQYKGHSYIFSAELDE